MSYHRKTTSGIATALVAVIVIVIVVIAGVGAYVAVTSGSSTSSTSSHSTTSVVSTTTSSSTTAGVSSSSSSTSSSSTSATSSTTSSSSSTSSPQSSTSEAVSSTTSECTTTYGSNTATFSTGTGGVGSLYSPLIDLFGNFSQMSMVFNTTDTASYQVVGKPNLNGVATYEVNYNSTYAGQPLVGTAYFAMNGTIVQVITNGQTETGYMTFLALTAFIPFYIETTFADVQSFYTSSSFVSVENQSTIQVGPSTVAVTNYKANNLPFTVSECGYTSTVNKFTLQIGQVSGVNYSLMTFADFEGSSDSTPYAFTLQITSVSK